MPERELRGPRPPSSPVGPTAVGADSSVSFRAQQTQQRCNRGATELHHKAEDSSASFRVHCRLSREDDERINAAYGRQLLDAAHDGDSATVRTLLSTPHASSFINYQDEDGITTLHFAVQQEHAAVAKQLIAARCNVDLQVLNLIALPVQKYKY